MSNLILVITIILILSTGLSNAAIINVPDDHETIQAGINASEDGDTVLVAPGEYVENINFDGKAITVMGNPRNPRETIIAGNENGSVISFDQNEDENSVVTGFTIQNGSGTEDPDGDISGGGLYIIDSSPTLENLHIVGNRAEYGGGIYLKQSSPNIFKVYIYGNIAEERGAGLYCSSECSPTISYTTICNNYTFNSYGAGLYGYNNCRISMLNCTIAMNEVVRLGRAGGIMISNNTTLELVNCIIWGNGDLPLNLGGGDNDTLILKYCDLEGGRGDIRVGGQGDKIYWDDNGNRSSDPLFFNSDNGDYRLTEDSPCIDAGDPESPEDPDESRADMGAFYFDQVQQNDNQPTPFNLVGPENQADLDVGEIEYNVPFIWQASEDQDEMAVISYSIRIVREIWVWEEDPVLDDSIVTIHSTQDSTITINFREEFEQYGHPIMWLPINWSVSVVSQGDTVQCTEPFKLTLLAGDNVDDDGLTLPTNYAISGVFPNPFNSSVRINYTVPINSAVLIKLYDIRGSLVDVIAGGVINSGRQFTTWDATDMPSGIYFTRMETGGFTQTVKLILMR